MKKKNLKFTNSSIHKVKKYKFNFRMFKYIIFYSIIFVLLAYSISYAAEPTIVKKLNSAFTKIRDWMIKLATPAAAIAVGTGVFITKFSFGDDDKILKGKRLIRTTLYSYGFIIAVELVLKAIDSLVG